MPLRSLRHVTSPVFDAAQRLGAPAPAPRHLTLGGGALPVAGSARVYVCGITPYDVTHLGHASTFVWADVLATVLDLTGAEVRTCRNVTDVDDVLLDAARLRGDHFDELALMQEAIFDQSMRALRVATPSEQPHARHHIDAVVQLAQALLDAGAAYESEGTVWFRGAGVAERTGLDRERLLALSAAYGDRPDDPAKADPFDVAIWRPSVDEQPAWPSPWGWGRPGWHAECAAMAMAVHGPSVDVLVGGEDLAFPHHAYQSAMVEAVARVTPFARAVLHVGEVRIDGEKMAKSTGNLVLVDDLLRDVAPATLRLHLLHRRYADAWDFDADGLAATQDLLDALYAAASKPGAGDPVAVDDALRADLDVPAAVAAALEQGGESARRLISVLRLA
ncbi:cysteine--tRNA ligase [Nocardioides sp. GY 10113]|uniref:cysteine--tRNA ligase n=1 Tax=Nocardioides sp. GY 10113 TaxID=2569761 RepID=UPI0010A91A82|nr:cysteine--tRNA ligase [Nocardioides sp. GY 10113]TIC88306.1 cysteine--tRNA ligase [Nocardioides sp. GY 10113]